MKPEDHIKSTIQKFFHAMDTQDFKLMESLIAKQEDMVHIGTDEGEIWQGWRELKKATQKQFKNLEYYKADIQNLNINIADSGDMACYSHLLNAHIKSTDTEFIWENARFTGVLIKEKDCWVLLQTHVSVPESI